MQALFVKKQKFSEIFKKPFTKPERCVIIYKSLRDTVINDIGVSPSGKAADSDSVISRVQILPPQPNSSEGAIGRFPVAPFLYTLIWRVRP